MDAGRRVRRHPLRDRRAARWRAGDREDHDRPPRGAQRLPPADAVRAARGLHAGPGRPRRRRDHPHRRGPGRVLLGRRPAHPRRRRLHGRRQRREQGHRAPERARPPDPDAPLPEARRGHDRGLCDRRRPRAARLLRPVDRRRQRALRPDGPARRLLRRRLRLRPARPPDRPEARQGGVVPVPAVRRRDRAGLGPGQRGRAARAPRGGDGRVVPRDARPLAPRAADAQGVASTPPRTAWPASSSSPETRRCSST